MACLDVRPLVQVDSPHAGPFSPAVFPTRLAQGAGADAAGAQNKTPDSFQNRGFVFTGATYRVRTGDHWNHNPDTASLPLVTAYPLQAQTLANKGIRALLSIQMSHQTLTFFW